MSTFASVSPPPRPKGAAPVRVPRSRIRRGLLRLRATLPRLGVRRRLRYTRGGVLFTVGALTVGFAALNTGNNLLYLLLGAVLGFIALSGWLSEQALRGLEVRRVVPRGIIVGRPARLSYEVTNRKRRAPSFALEITESGLPGLAFAACVPARGVATAKHEVQFVQRGVFPLETLTVSTSFPFGLFRKEGDRVLVDELVIWPRSDREVREPVAASGRARREGVASVGTPGARGEYRGLHVYRPGDDPKDIHWRTSARFGSPVVREYDRDEMSAVWICLDTADDPGLLAEWCVEAAASLAARALANGRRVGLDSPQRTVPPASGPGQLEQILDALARVDFVRDHRPPRPPVEAERCVLVSIDGRGAELFGDVIQPGKWS